MYHSEDMTLNQILFAKESMWETMNYLSFSEKVMFIEKTGNTQKIKNSLTEYAGKMLKRCEDLLIELNLIREQCLKFKWPLTNFEKEAREYLREVDDYCLQNKIENSHLFVQLEIHIKKKFNILQKHIEHYEKLIQQRIHLLYQLNSVAKIEDLIPFEFLKLDQTRNFDHKNTSKKRFSSFLGIISTLNLNKLRKILFRLSRENIIVHSLQMEELKDEQLSFYFEYNKKMEKSLMFILYPKTEGEFFDKKIEEILNIFEFEKITLSKIQEKNGILQRLNEELRDNKKIIIQTKFELNQILESFSSPKITQKLSFLQILLLIINREKNFAQKLIFIEEKDGFYQLLCWVPASFQETLSNGFENIKISDKNFIKPKLYEITNFSSIHQKNLIIPTRFKLTIFTKPFQDLINTYGVPCYKEANPGLFTIITFPFLFGLMFGDVGHGFLLFSFAIFLIFFYDKISSPFFRIKYLLLLMGFFSIFCGLIYNEFFSFPLVFLQSCYSHYFKRKNNCTYIFGLDWIWSISQNSIEFTNSFKMKFSIIVGVLHMLLGIVLKCHNFLHKFDFVSFFFEALPQFIFMTVTFGYMVFCIIFKWLQNWDN